MACCMLLALIAGNFALMWRRIRTWWSPGAAAQADADARAAAWRPGMTSTYVPSYAPFSRGKWHTGFINFYGIALIVISLSYFALQAKMTCDAASNGHTFARLLMQNLCRSAQTGETSSHIASLAAKTDTSKER